MVPVSVDDDFASAKGFRSAIDAVRVEDVGCIVGWFALSRVWGQALNMLTQWDRIITSKYFGDMGGNLFDYLPNAIASANAMEYTDGDIAFAWAHGNALWNCEVARAFVTIMSLIKVCSHQWAHG